MGKVTVIKTFALPKLVYPFSVLPNPSQKVINELETEMFRFLWNNKPDKIKRKRLMQNYDQGGLKLPNINSFLLSLKSCWVKRYIDETNNGQWKEIFKIKLNKYGGELLFESNIHETDIRKMFRKDSLVFDIMNSWSIINNIYVKNKLNNEARYVIMWNNNDIQHSGRTLFYSSWYNKGIKYL